MKRIIKVEGKTTKIDGTKLPPHSFTRDELDDIPKEILRDVWEIGKFPKLSKKHKKLNIGKFIVYGTINHDEINTK